MLYEPPEEDSNQIYNPHNMQSTDSEQDHGNLVPDLLANTHQLARYEEESYQVNSSLKKYFTDQSEREPAVKQFNIRFETLDKKSKHKLDKDPNRQLLELELVLRSEILRNEGLQAENLALKEVLDSKGLSTEFKNIPTQNPNSYFNFLS